MKSIILTISLLIIIFETSAQNTDFEIQYSVHTITNKTGEGEFIDTNGLPEPTNEYKWVILEKNGNFKTYTEKNHHTLYDFNNEMVFKYNSDTLFDVYPVYSILDYRVAEYHNRTFLTNLLKAGGVGGVFGDLTNLESIFGIEIPEDHIRDSIQSSTIKDTATFSFHDSVMVKVHYSKSKLSKQFTTSFSKFLTYQLEIHPSIKETITKKNRVPDFIQYSYTNVGQKITKTYRLTETGDRVSKDDELLTRDRFLVKNTSSEINVLIDSMMFYTILNIVPSIDSNFYFTTSKQLSDSGAHLSGLLCLLEYVLSTGTQPTQRIKEIIAPYQKTDSLLGSFIYCLNSPNSKEEAEEKIGLLNEMINLKLKYGYVMNIFAANYITPIDKYEAQTYFTKALTKGTNITGAWRDLGITFADQFDYTAAWKCYSIAQRINSIHPMSLQIQEKKDHLSLDYPEYFLSIFLE